MEKAKDRAQSQKIVPDPNAKLEYESAPGQEINKEEESTTTKAEPTEVFKSVMPEPLVQVANNEPQMPAAEQAPDLNTNDLHVPFIQQRISDIKDDIEKEKVK